MIGGVLRAAACSLFCLLETVAVAATPAADRARGEIVYQRCLACHALAYHRVGPLHCGVVGRRAGSTPGYDYSEAMRDSGLVWSKSRLDAFLAAPTQVVQGTTMTYAGVDDARDRRDLIAYLAAAAGDPERCPTTDREEHR